MKLPVFPAGSDPAEKFRLIRQCVQAHDGPIDKSDVLALLRATLEAAASVANTRDTFVSLSLNEHKNGMY